MTVITNPEPTKTAPLHWTVRGFANPYLLLTIAALCWSGNHIAGRAMGGHVPPLSISAVRWLIPALLIWPWVRPHLARDWPAIRAHWKIMLWLGLTGGALFTSLQYVGLQYTSALNVSVMNSLVPVLIVATGALTFRDRVSLRQIGGIALSSLGVLAIIAHGRFATLLSLDFNWGDLLILFNMMVFSVYAVYLRLLPKIHPLSFLFVLAVLSTAITVPFAMAEVAAGVTLRLDFWTLASIAYVSFFPGLVAFAAWNRGVELIGANRSGPFLHLVPICTALVGGVLLGEHLALYHIAGFVLIIAGVWLAAKRTEGAVA
ncbi:MAG: DMT family transporter [Pseudolabrys sp.]|nr:DMT family transporter [Pseudolabrys sp.]